MSDSLLQGLAAGLTGSSPSSYVQLVWYGEGLNSGSMPKGSVNLFDTGTTASVSLTGNDLSINFGANGITSLLTENGVSGTGNPTKTFGDGWYALGINVTGNASNGPTFWLPFIRLLGNTDGDGVVTGPYPTPNTDAYAVYRAQGQSGSLLDPDVNGDGTVNSKDVLETAAAKGAAVGTTPPQNFPSFPTIAGAAAPGNGAAPSASAGGAANVVLTDNPQPQQPSPTSGSVVTSGGGRRPGVDAEPDRRGWCSGSCRDQRRAKKSLGRSSVIHVTKKGKHPIRKPPTRPSTVTSTRCPPAKPHRPAHSFAPVSRASRRSKANERHRYKTVS